MTDAYCIYCGQQFWPESSLGQWECWYHPGGEADLSTNRYPCCGQLVEEGAADMGWLWLGCTRCDHTTEPWPLTDDPSPPPKVFSPVYALPQGFHGPGYAGPFQTKQQVLTAAAVPRSVPEAERDAAWLALKRDVWSEALWRDAPLFFEALAAHRLGPTVEAAARIRQDALFFFLQRAYAQDGHRWRSMAHNPLTVALAVKSWDTIAAALRWLAQESQRKDMALSYVAQHLAPDWEAQVTAWLADDTSVANDITWPLIPVHVISRTGPRPNGKAVWLGHHEPAKLRGVFVGTA